MSTATPAANDAPKPGATATPAPAANATPAPAATDKGQAAPSATDPKATGTPAPTSDPAPIADAGDDDDSGTLLDDGDGDEPSSTPAADDGKSNQTPVAWRDDALKAVETKWLSKAKTDDDKKVAADKAERFRKWVARYAKEEAALEAGFEASERLRNKQDSEPLSKDASPEEQAEWREKQGLPKEAKDISIPRVEITTEDGRRAYHEWTEADKPLHDSFREVAFKLGLPQAQVDDLVKWHFRQGLESRAALDKQLLDMDKEDLRHATDAMRDEWGREYDGRQEVFKRMVNGKAPNTLPPEAAALLKNARDPATGKRLLFHPDIVALVTDAAQFRMGDGAFISGDAKAAIADEEEKLVNLMKTNFEEYIRTGSDKKLMALRERKSGKGKRAA